LAVLRAALQEGRQGELCRAAHTFKGHVGAFSKRALGLALKLEKLAEQGDLGAAQGALGELERNVAGLKLALEGWGR
jgi:HPt (histidine-containing phosphotransfer) domain-containing protein